MSDHRRPGPAVRTAREAPGPSASRPAAWRSPDVARWAGLVGTVLITLASYRVAAVPDSLEHPQVAVLGDVRAGSHLVLAVHYVGLGLLVLAWLRTVRLVLDHGVGWRHVRVTALAWAAPLLVAVPLASRDLWAYLAQGALLAQHQDPYAVGPEVLTGPLAHLNAQVTAVWQGVPSPYGPLWLVLSRAAVGLSGGHALLGVLVLRLVVAAAVVALVAVAPPLAVRLGGRPALALVLTAANPLLLLHGIGGGHNDLVMIALVAVALLIVLARAEPLALVGAGAVVGAAAAVKFPGAVAAPFLAVVWLRRTGHPLVLTTARDVRRVVGALALAAAGTVASFALITAASGLGLGWWREATDKPGTNGLAVAGLAVALVVLWVKSLRWPPVPLLGLALAAMLLLGPQLLPWYWFWPLVPAAVVVRRRWAVIVTAVGSVALVVQVQPNGGSAHLQWSACLALAALLTVPALDDRRPPVGSYLRSVTRHRGGDATRPDARPGSRSGDHSSSAPH